MNTSINPLPLWENPLPGVWSFAQNDTTSAAIVLDGRTGFYRYEYGTVLSVTLHGRAISKDEAFRKVNLHHALCVNGEQANVIAS